MVVDPKWSDGGKTEIFVVEDRDGLPGTYTDPAGIGTHTREFDGCGFARCWYFYHVQDLEIELAPGKYWIGIRHPEAGGRGTGYWKTSDGGPDGGDSSTGYFSLDAGQTWQPEGAPTWHHAFVIGGREVPEPTALSLSLIGGVSFLSCARRSAARRGHARRRA